MKIVNTNVKLLMQEDMRKHIELCGRTCYKSIDKITETSSGGFVQKLILNKHHAMLEHGTVYITLKNDENKESRELLLRNPYTEFNVVKKGDKSTFYITTNYRVILELGLYTIIKNINARPTKHHPKRYTVKIICDRATSHELVRHRKFSFAQESQRYCNYSKDKFGNEITFIEVFSKLSKKSYKKWIKSCKQSEKTYMSLIEMGIEPQLAREVLPNCTKTEIIMTGFEDDWENFFNLRCVNGVQPSTRKIAEEIRTLIRNN